MDAVWDTETQEVHGGQTWRALGERFVSDFSVTTNAFGAPAAALDAARAALADVHHYPAADNGDAIAALARFTGWEADKLLVGNGASEFIDLVMRTAPPGPFKPGPYKAAYMEYNRAAIASGREILPYADERDAGVTVVIHPNSPTGDCMSLDGLRDVLEGTKGIVVVDESFIPFYGPEWRSVSALELVTEYPDKLLVLSSWTKLWSCPGLRLGSIAGSASWIKKLKKLQTPWSCNTLAQAFFVSACADTDYMKKTWAVLPGWKAEQIARLKALGWTPNPESPLWVPWVYFDCHDAVTATKATAVAQDAGCPVRHCASFGTPTCIRVGVRDPAEQAVLQDAWVKAFVDPNDGATHGKA